MPHPWVIIFQSAQSDGLIQEHSWQASLGAEKETAAASVILRLARDTFALLPILAILIRVHNVPDGVMDEVCFERRTFACTTFTNSNPVKLMAKLCVQQ